MKNEIFTRISAFFTPLFLPFGGLKSVLNWDYGTVRLIFSDRTEVLAITQVRVRPSPQGAYRRRFFRLLPGPQSLPALIPQRHCCLKGDIFWIIPPILEGQARLDCVRKKEEGRRKKRPREHEPGRGARGQQSVATGAGGNGRFRPARRLRPDKVKACINAVIHALSASLKPDSDGV